jgi:hypothetical protein
MKRFNNRGIVTEYLPWILIAVSVLVILVIGTIVLKDKGIAVIDKIAGLFRGR